MGTRLQPTVFCLRDPRPPRPLSHTSHTPAVSGLSDDILIPAFHYDLSTCSVRQLDSTFVPLEPFRPKASEFSGIDGASIVVLRPRLVLRPVFWDWRNGWCARAPLCRVLARRLLPVPIRCQQLFLTRSFSVVPR